MNSETGEKKEKENRKEEIFTSISSSGRGLEPNLLAISNSGSSFSIPYK